MNHTHRTQKEVMQRANEIMGSEKFKSDYTNRRVDAFQQAYTELVENNL